MSAVKFLQNIFKSFSGDNDSDERKELINQLQKEYEIIQNKLDKIGEFKFRIKGWSITLISALVAASFHKDYSQSILLVGPLIILVFQRTEFDQHLLQRTLSTRARFIERAISELIDNFNVIDKPAILRRLKGSPSIGRNLSMELRRNKPKYLSSSQFWNSRLNFFYLFQYGIIFLTIIIHNWQDITEITLKIVLNHTCRLTDC